MKRSIFLILITLFVGMSCSTVTYTPATDEIVAQVPAIAEKYLGMEYEWGGQDWWWNGGSVDCSGLVINVYKEACEDSGYTLPYEDSTVLEIYNSYSIHTDAPRIGDIIFMVDPGASTLTHIAILVAKDSESIKFIDAYSVSGFVEKRSCEIANPKILTYGTLLMHED